MILPKGHSSNFPPPKDKNMKKRIYIAGPITKGDMLHNIQQAEQAFRQLYELGFAPWIPHLSVYYESAERERHEEWYNKVRATADAYAGDDINWIDIDLAWVHAADGVLRLPGESKGADKEVAYALDHEIPVFYSVEDAAAYYQEKP